jgi:hypothetical protein
MRHLRALLCAAVLLVGTFFPESTAQGQQGPSDTPTIQVTSRLVFLDVTVLDKKGRPVVKGLGKDDFTITEDKRPQSIFSFEAPQTHTISRLAGDDNPDGKAPLTIFVLDLLNSSFEDFAFIRYSVQKYLATQPPLLNSPAEMMVIGNKSLELMQAPPEIRPICSMPSIICRLRSHTSGSPTVSLRSVSTNRSMPCNRSLCKIRACQDERTSFGLVMGVPASAPGV